MNKIKTHKDLEVFKTSFSSGMEVFEMTKSFPKEETYSLTDQIRRSSRSVSGNIAEAFRKRVIRKHLSQNYPIRKAKPRKHKYGLIMLWRVDT